MASSAPIDLAALGPDALRELIMARLAAAPRDATVVFPHDARGASWPGDAKLTMHAHDDALACNLEASAPEQLEALKGAVVRHIDRFAFREAPLTFEWKDA